MILQLQMGIMTMSRVLWGGYFNRNYLILTKHFGRIGTLGVHAGYQHWPKVGLSD